jgi:3-oxoacyl-[acyl-carrier protein] reductase
MNTHSSRVALVTGGSRGIGAGIVERFVADGTRVAFTYAASDASADALAERLESSGVQVLAIRADSTDPEALARAVDETVARFGRFDILVNNAGRYIPGAFDEMTAAEIDSMISLNIMGAVTITRYALAHLGEGGRIINIGSTNADHNPFPGGAIYALTKGAIASFTRGLSGELAPRRITINTIQPGPVRSGVGPDDDPMWRGFIPDGRFGSVNDVASLASFLAGQEAQHITGTSITVDGGMSA